MSASGCSFQQEHFILEGTVRCQLPHKLLTGKIIIKQHRKSSEHLIVSQLICPREHKLQTKQHGKNRRENRPR